MKALEGLKVVELATFIAGPACPRQLAELGAEVIKIEAFEGDQQRTQGPGYGMERDDIEDPAFDMGGMCKNWMAINLKNKDGIELVYKVLETADVLVTNFRDKALVKLGLDYETISAKFPGLVYAHMRGYGARGPEKDSKGFDATAYSARGGILRAFPQLGDAPVNVPAGFGDWNTSAFLMSGILAALLRKQRTGLGDKVVVNLYHVACWAMNHAIVSRQSGALYPRSRKAVPTPSNNCYQSKDGAWFLICEANYNAHYEKMAKAFEIEELIGNDKYATLEQLTADKTNTYVIDLFDKAFAKKEFDAWEEVFRANDIPFQKAFTVDDILADQEAWDNDILRHVKYDNYPKQTVIPTGPIRLKSNGDPDLWTAKPVGYDTRRYMKECGYSEAEIEKLLAEGAVKAYEGKELRFDKVSGSSAKIELP